MEGTACPCSALWGTFPCSPAVVHPGLFPVTAVFGLKEPPPPGGSTWGFLIIPHLELLLWNNSFPLFLEGPAALLKPSPECCCVPGCG